MTSQKWIKWRLNHDPGFHVMILLSAFLHTAILSMIFLLPSLPSPKLTFGPVYSVQLVSFSDTFFSRKDIPAVSGEFSDRALSDRSFILKKKADTDPSLPVKKTDIQRQDFSDVEKAMDKIRQKVSLGKDPLTFYSGPYCGIVHLHFHADLGITGLLLRNHRRLTGERYLLPDFIHGFFNAAEILPLNVCFLHRQRWIRIGHQGISRQSDGGGCAEAAR